MYKGLDSQYLPQSIEEGRNIKKKFKTKSRDHNRLMSHLKGYEILAIKLKGYENGR